MKRDSIVANVVDMCLVVYFDSTVVVKFTRSLLLFKT